MRILFPIIINVFYKAKVSGLCFWKSNGLFGRIAGLFYWRIFSRPIRYPANYRIWKGQISCQPDIRCCPSYSTAWREDSRQKLIIYEKLVSFVTEFSLSLQIRFDRAGAIWSLLVSAVNVEKVTCSKILPFYHIIGRRPSLCCKTK